jgi:hypothetical protein
MHGKDLLAWGIKDLKGKPIEKIREIRDDMEQRVSKLAAGLVKKKSRQPKIRPQKVFSRSYRYFLL